MGVTGYSENAWVGIGEETTWGSAVTRTKFLEIISENIRTVKPVNARTTLRTASRRYWIPGKKSVEGGLRTELLYEGFEKILKHVMGAGADSALAGGAYLHTFTLAAQPPTGLTVEVNRDVCAWVYHGCQIQSLTIENAVDGAVMLSMEVLGEDETTGAASTPTFPADKPIHWTQVSVLTSGTDTIQASNVRLNIANTLATDRYKLGLRTRKAIGRGGRRIINGSFTAEFEDVTQYNNFINETEKELTVTWTGAVIGSGNSYLFTAKMPRIVLTGETPPVSGPGPIIQTLNFEAFDNINGSATGTGPLGLASQDELILALVNTTTVI